MIDFLRGRLVEKEPTHVIIDVNGIGYRVWISLTTFTEIKEKEDLTLLTYLHIKEDSHTLFGFMHGSEKEMFLKLIGISGVGPSTALMVQSSLSATELRDAIVQEDVHTIKGVKGIGVKTAQRIILELKDKISNMDISEGSAEPAFSHNTLKNEALSALTTLGISRPVAEKHINSILKSSGSDLSLEELIKHVLKNT